jgi:glycosyltransferase involved in cell wall biosynthesis
MKTSVLIITYKRLPLLANCINSIFQNTQKDDLEILVGFNGDRDNYNNFLFDSKLKDIPLKKYYFDRVNNGQARNQLLAFATGEWICFLDDDTTLPGNYFEQANQLLSTHTNITVLGGPDQTPDNSTFKQKLIGSLQESFLVTGPTHLRHSKTSNEPRLTTEISLILCNLWIKKSVFSEPTISFPFSVSRNEENILLSLLHRKKDRFQEIARVVFSSGYNRMSSFFLIPTSFNPIYLLPMILFFYVIFTFITNPHPLFLFPLLIYFSLLFFLGLKILFKHKHFLFLPLTIWGGVLIHSAYAIGLIFSLINSLVTLAHKPKKITPHET